MQPFVDHPQPGARARSNRVVSIDSHRCSKAEAVRLSWNEIRAPAARFADEWANAKYEKGEARSFYNDFFDVFGIKRRKVASFADPVNLTVS